MVYGFNVFAESKFTGQTKILWLLNLLFSTWRGQP